MQLREEVSVHQSLRFPHIVQMLGACCTPPNLCLVMELAVHGSCYSLLHLQSEVDLPMPLRVAMLFDAARGLR